LAIYVTVDVEPEALAIIAVLPGNIAMTARLRRCKKQWRSCKTRGKKPRG
jgi:hypothetical protein